MGSPTVYEQQRDGCPRPAPRAASAVTPIAPPFPTPDHLALNPREIDDESISMQLGAALLSEGKAAP